MKYVLCAVVLLLSGCATTQNTVSISCFAGKEFNRSKAPKDINLPLIINSGTVLYYDDEGVLNRLNDAVCGVQK